jgi:succinate dehydrogenase / fumarate reductase membrane anchor subunit
VSAILHRRRLAVFVVMRTTAVVLAVLVIGHFALTHLLTDVSDTGSSFVMRRWSSGLWLAWDWTMLAAALIHGATGAWLIVEEQVRGAAARRLHAAIVVTSTLLLTLGTAALVVGSARGT